LENQGERQMTAPEYIRANFHPSDRLAVLVRKRGCGETIQRISTADKIAATPFQDWLHYKSEKENCDIYIGMNALKPDSHTRTKDDIWAIRHLYVDLDHDGTRSLAAIEQSDLVPKPSYVLNTSPDKFQVVWKVEGMTPTQAESMLHAIAAQFDGDPAATDSTRVLRLPGFANKKYEQDFLVKVHSQTGQTYHPHDFKLRTEPVDAGPARWNQSQDRYAASATRRDRLGSTEPHELSQSERDWAYAKRALSRGESPEDIIRNIAEFRAYDKPNPQDYARRTVTKAQAELQRGTAFSQSSEESPSHTSEPSHEGSR
jgi:RepB DNA-primase N-terminal domain/RepB DNA-primase C-terminal helical domain